jgi:outer membrane protein OmpA-like peptidoglycan-associated protein
MNDEKAVASTSSQDERNTEFGPPSFAAPVSGGTRDSGPDWWALSALLAALAALLGGSTLLVLGKVQAAGERLTTLESDRPQVVLADQAEAAYCTPEFKHVLERVLHACGLDGGTSRRGCQPADVKSLASISDGDFNALFAPLKERGAVLLFDNAADELDAGAKQLLDERFQDRLGARYFFVVARASKSGNMQKNRALSHRRANSVMFYLQKISGETEEELNQRVGLLWLGNEYAQLSQEYCEWPRSRAEAECGEEPINRSAFVSWVDCRL